jgi:hypothetical protein
MDLAKQTATSGLIILIMTLITSCDPFLGPARIGLTRTPSGQPYSCLPRVLESR